jgi:mannose-6-phosphate isomerase-like protein (cupin superfamily)
MEKLKILKFAILLLLLFITCKEPTVKSEWTMTSDKTTWPDADYLHPPLTPFDTNNYVIQLQNMPSFYGNPGEFGYILEGNNYGFDSLSFILTNTQPKYGPRVHVHDHEEAHILLEGDVLYYIDGKEFSAKGPYVTRVPAGVPHTFINTGNKPFHLIGAFPRKHIVDKDVGPNPLIKDTSSKE